MEYLYGTLQTLEQKTKPFTDEERLLALRNPLISWYRKNRRILPWREKPEPYRVWISEIMLQQTRVEAVKPYFERFIGRLPDVRELAEAEEKVLLKFWEGLGYYNRARNLQKAARMMVEQYGGKLPASYEELLKLPGIGSYTAGAIASIAYGIKEPAVDGNVLRVLSRILANREDIGKLAVKKKMEQLIRSVMGEEEQPGEYNQAWIELGALICIPAGAPLCSVCPCESVCLAKKQDLLDEIPVKAKKKKRKIEEKTIFLIEYQDSIAIRKRTEEGLLASLYEFPNLPGHLEEDKIKEELGLLPQDLISIKRLPDSTHIFSHIEWHMIGYHLKVRKEYAKRYKMIKRIEILEKYPLPNAFGTYTKVLM